MTNITKYNFSLLKLKTKKIFKLKSRNPKPHFLGIGTQKGGTTTLYQLLKQHEDIFLPANKEIHYFTKHYDKGPQWYIDHFREAKPGKIRGEITPYYVFHAATPRRISKCNRNIKLILLLRNPVERTLSQYFHSVRLGLEELTLEEALNAESERLKDSESIIQAPGSTHLSHQEHSYISRSRYDIQIKRYLNFFKPKNLLILRSEDVFANNFRILQSISSFLNISEFNSKINFPKANVGLGESANVKSELKMKIKEELSYTYKWIKEEIGISWD